MLKRVGTITKELTVLRRAGKVDSKEYHNKTDRLNKYRKALEGPRKAGSFDYAKAREQRAKGKDTGKESQGTSAVAALIRTGLKGPLKQVGDKAKAAASDAQGREGTGGKKTGASRSAYERHMRREH